MSHRAARAWPRGRSACRSRPSRASVAPITQKESDDLGDLKPADDAKDDWQVVVDKQNEGNDLLKKIRDKAEAKDRSGLQDLQKAPAIGQDFAAAAKKIGAVGCAAGLTG